MQPPTNNKKALDFLANTFKAQSTAKLHNIQMLDQRCEHVLARLRDRQRVESLMTGGCGSQGQ